MSHSAPSEVIYCCRCASTMETRTYGGKLRRVCSACNYIHFVEPKVGVGVLVVEASRLLLVQRAMNPEKGKWSLPAGYLDSGEDPAATAVRETLEETSLEVAVSKLIDVYHNPPEQGGASVFILYQAKVVGGELQAGDDALDAKFFDLRPESLPEIAFKSTWDAVRRLLST